MSEPAAVVSSSPAASSARAGTPRLYAPSWLHVVVAFVGRLPGPTWIAYVVTWVAATLYWHVEAWSRSAVPVGSVDSTSVYWGLLGPALLWSAAFMERVAASTFDAFRPALTLSADDAARLRHMLIVLPARPALVITIVAATVTALDMSFSGSPSYAGLTFPFTILTFLVQSVYVSILFQFLYRLIRQMVLVRRTLATSVAIDIFRPAPLHAFATLTSRPGAVLVLLVASSTLLVPIQGDVVALLFSFVPYMVLPPLIAMIAFVVPLTGVHAALVEQKVRLQDAAQGRLQAALTEMAREVDAGDLSRADAWSKTLGNLQVEGAILAKLPTWPWSMSMLRSFVSAILLPTALFLVQLALSRAF